MKDVYYRPCVYMDFLIDKEAQGRVTIELFAEALPTTCENFRALCTGEKGISPLTGNKLHYKGSFIHRVHPGMIMQGGNIAKAVSTEELGEGEDYSLNYNDTGESIYGPVFDDESFDFPHSKRGIVSMVNSGPNSNGSQFFITFNAARWLDKKHVAFGEVIDGFDILERVEQIGDEEGNVRALITVSDSGELFRGVNETIFTDSQLRIKLAWAFALFETPQYPGAVDKSELSFVMAKIGFPFSLEDHATAISVLDIEKNGKIGLDEFTSWWFQHHFRRTRMGLEEGEVYPYYENRLGANHITAKAQLLKVQKERKETDAQVKALKTRISLLKKNEIKAWKEIKFTKNKILESLKKEKEEEEKEREEESVNKDKSVRLVEAMEGQDRRYVELELRRLSRLRATQSVLRIKKEKAIETKIEKKKNLNVLLQHKAISISTAVRNRNLIQTKHQEATRKKEMQDYQKRLNMNETYVQSIKMEEDLCLQRAKERRQLEEEEEELLSRLKIAQEASKKTEQQLDSLNSSFSPRINFVGK